MTDQKNKIDGRGKTGAGVGAEAEREIQIAMAISLNLCSGGCVCEMTTEGTTKMGRDRGSDRHRLARGT